MMLNLYTFIEFAEKHGDHMLVDENHPMISLIDEFFQYRDRYSPKMPMQKSVKTEGEVSTEDTLRGMVDWQQKQIKKHEKTIKKLMGENRPVLLRMQRILQQLSDCETQPDIQDVWDRNQLGSLLTQLKIKNGED